MIDLTWSPRSGVPLTHTEQLAITSSKVVAFAKLLDEIKPRGLDYRSTVYPGENHNSVRLASIPSGLYWVYRPTGSR